MSLFKATRGQWESGGAAFNNNPGAVYDIQNDNGIAMTTFNNYGLFKKSAGTGTSLVTGNHFNDFGPGGTVEVDSGTLAFGGNNNYFFTNTLFVVSNGASLGFEYYQQQHGDRRRVDGFGRRHGVYEQRHRIFLISDHA